MKKEHAKELWNILNTQRNALLSELYFVENTLGLMEKRTGATISDKLMYTTSDINFVGFKPKTT